jgi:hypothetical protein
MKDTPLPFTVCATTKVGFAVGGLRLVERLLDLADVVAVDLDDRPAEGLPLRMTAARCRAPSSRSCRAGSDSRRDDHEVVEGMIGLAELRRRHRGLPHLAFLNLAVAQDAVDARGRAGELEPERQAEEIESPWPSEPVAASMPGSADRSG